MNKKNYSEPAVTLRWFEQTDALSGPTLSGLDGGFQVGGDGGLTEIDENLA